MHLSHEQMLDLSQFAFIRLDGAWFLALTELYGLEAAWKVDVEAWKRFSYVFGKRLRKEFFPEPVWPDTFVQALEILSKVLKIEGRQVLVEGDRITVRVTDCETQKAIAKAGVADCGIATIQTYQGLFKGLFGKEADIRVEHTRNLNRGDEFCEVVVTR